MKSKFKLYVTALVFGLYLGAAIALAASSTKSLIIDIVSIT